MEEVALATARAQLRSAFWSAIETLAQPSPADKPAEAETPRTRQAAAASRSERPAPARVPAERPRRTPARTDADEQDSSDRSLVCAWNEDAADPGLERPSELSDGVKDLVAVAALERARWERENPPPPRDPAPPPDPPDPIWEASRRPPLEPPPPPPDPPAGAVSEAESTGERWEAKQRPAAGAAQVSWGGRQRRTSSPFSDASGGSSASGDRPRRRRGGAGGRSGRGRAAGAAAAALELALAGRLPQRLLGPSRAVSRSPPAAPAAPAPTSGTGPARRPSPRAPPRPGDERDAPPRPGMPRGRPRRPRAPSPFAAYVASIRPASRQPAAPGTSLNATCWARRAPLPRQLSARVWPAGPPAPGGPPRPRAGSMHPVAAAGAVFPAVLPPGRPKPQATGHVRSKSSPNFPSSRLVAPPEPGPGQGPPAPAASLPATFSPARAPPVYRPLHIRPLPSPASPALAPTLPQAPRPSVRLSLFPVPLPPAIPPS
eukprot:tig00020604_g11854.t1